MIAVKIASGYEGTGPGGGGAFGWLKGPIAIAKIHAYSLAVRDDHQVQIAVIIEIPHGDGIESPGVIDGSLKGSVPVP